MTEKVIETLKQYRQKKIFEKEAGGQLFAQFDGADTYIVDATPPNPSDKRGRFSFRPDRNIQQIDIARRYTMGLHFAGDWHTHPQPIPSPSSIDIASMIECFNKSKHGLKAFLIVIVGVAEPPLGIYVGLVRNNTIEKMNLDTIHPPLTSARW